MEAEPEAVIPAGWTVERKAATRSTMDDAKALARNGAPDRTAVVALEQTGGRGTGGRTWSAPPGGLYTSFVLRGVQNPHFVTLALGNAVADVLDVAGVDARLKWVNDVYVGDKKIAGILVEGESTGASFDFLVCGIGININGSAQAFPADVRALATTLEDELGCDSCVPDLESFLWQSIDKWLATLAASPADVLEAFRGRDWLKGKRVQVTGSGATGGGATGSGATVTGVASGVDEDGHLVIRDGARTAHVSGGSVSLLG